MAMVTRFRAAERDVQVDVARLGVVMFEVCKALRSIEREQAGLGRRLEDARARAATLMGTEDGIYGEREPADEKLLVEAEKQMMYAYKRLTALKSQQAALASVMQELKSTGADPQSPALAQTWYRTRPAWADLARQVAAVLGWAILIGVALSTWSASGQPAGLSHDLAWFLAILVGAVALGIGYPRHRLLLFGLGLACLVQLEVARSVLGTGHSPLLEALAKVAGLAGALALLAIVARFFRQRLSSD